MIYPILNLSFLEIVLKEVPSESSGGHNLPLKNPIVIKREPVLSTFWNAVQII